MNARTAILFMIIFLMATVAFSESVKRDEFSGSFYPADKAQLNAMIDKFMFEAGTCPIKGKVLGIISPHAGYIYSGKVAAYSYKCLPKELIDSVIILCPSHRYSFKGISLYPEGFFYTPLGTLEVDKELVSSFHSLDFAKFEPDFFNGEHSLEVQLPFLMKVYPQAKIVPIVFGNLSYKQLDNLAEHISALAKKKSVILIASTDLSHFHPYAEACNLDWQTIKYITEKDSQRLWQSVGLREQRACGILPIITLILYAEKERARIEVIKYLNSGDTAGDKSKVVGYLSGVVLKDNKDSKKEEIMGLTKEEKITLLNIARKALESYLKDKKVPQFNVESETLHEKRAVFVTLKNNGRLRGCIGRIVADLPLYEVVAKQAVDAAIHDLRFPSVKYEELKDIEIEISVMTPFEKVSDLGEIEVGKHGLIIKKGFYQGLLLPQVPTEYGWDKETYLQHLCLKAGLDPQSYKDKDVLIYKFSADVFSEKELKN
jgi:AmmeMemoRadiSam system protein B/AmmeMemoRadiSam system protein A